MANLWVNDINTVLFGTDVSERKLHQTQILTLPDIYDNKIANAQGVKMVNDHESSNVWMRTSARQRKGSSDKFRTNFKWKGLRRF